MNRVLFIAAFALIGLTSCSLREEQDNLVNLIDPSGNIIAEFNCKSNEIRTFDNDSPFVIGKWYSKDDFISFATNDGIAAIDIPEIIRNLESQCEWYLLS